MSITLGRKRRHWLLCQHRVCSANVVVSVIEVKLGKLKCINDDCAYIPKLQLRALAHCHGSSQQTVCHQVVDDWLLHPETLAKVPQRGIGHEEDIIFPILFVGSVLSRN
ncbi:hypothetical protein DAI22_03g342400 [Oryza sativa Japonica Group]|uniref:Expressed protein n=1 Tax=Oryza sativa subsp. japonica TaxID=39947 RepID=Q10CP3_ORYSJ|nr:expressed protein [Oryza sativa Japonica Group]KAF2941380.1 hypothetical protein DAI22_03g342400 [Oryza sativa Japonica Group]BAG90651.1 unnamed protein product [Oryza sativa Japonica Group]